MNKKKIFERKNKKKKYLETGSSFPLYRSELVWKTFHVPKSSFYRDIPHSFQDFENHQTTFLVLVPRSHRTGNLLAKHILHGSSPQLAASEPAIASHPAGSCLRMHVYVYTGYRCS